MAVRGRVLCEARLMQLKWIPALSCLALFSFTAAAQIPTKEAKIERMLQLTNVDATIDQMLNQMKAMAASQVPPDTSLEGRTKAMELQGKIMDVVKARMSWEKLSPMYVKIYSEVFSEEEINGILAFYESPAGRAMLTKTPALIAKTMGWVQSQMRDVAPEIERLTKEALQK